MIAEVIVLSLAVVTVASIQFAKQVMRDEREADPLTLQRAAIHEKRRVLERDREEWAASLDGDSLEEASRRMDKVDRELLKLAEEEANL